jgi:hypothetical protein
VEVGDLAEGSHSHRMIAAWNVWHLFLQLSSRLFLLFRLEFVFKEVVCSYLPCMSTTFRKLFFWCAVVMFHAFPV